MSVLRERLGTWSLRRPGWAALLALVLLGLAGWRIATLRFDLDASAAVDTPAARALRQATQAFSLNERAYLLLESPEPDEARLLRLGQDLARRLEPAPCVARVELGPALPSDEELAELLAQTGVLYGSPAALEERLDPAGLEELLLQQAERLSLLGLGEVEGWVERDPLELNRAFAHRLSELRGIQRFAPDSTYALSEDRRALLLTVVTSRGPSELGFAREVAQTLARAREEALALPDFRGLEVSATGGHLFAEESERTIREDLTRGVALCSLLALFLLAWGLRLHPLATALLLLPTAWGVTCGLGLFGLLRPELAVLSLGCASVLLGLGVDFTIHLGTATRAARARGLGPREAARAGLRDTRGALVVAAATSIAAFLAFQIAGQRFLADMGLLTATGLLACLIGALFLAPPLLALILERSERPAPGPARTFGLGWLRAWPTKRPRTTVFLAILVSLAAGVALVQRPPRLSGDLRQLQAKGSPPLAAQARIAERFGGGLDPLLILIEAPTTAEVVSAARRLDPELQRYVREGRIAARASVAALLPDPEREAAVLGRLEGVEAARGGRALREAAEAVGFDPVTLAPAIRRWERALARRAPVTLDDLRRGGLGSLVERFVQPPSEGRPALGLILLTPRGRLDQAVERETLAVHLRRSLALARVEGKLTGLPYLTAETTARIGADFGAISLLTVLAVATVLLIRFRRPDHAFLALLPAALGTLWTGGAFAALGVDLNLMTLGVLPMVLALGVDDGIHVLHGHLELGGTREATRAIESGIWLTSLTTGVAFGSLWLSRNQGIATVGLLCLLGIGFCLVTSVAVLPALLPLRRDAAQARVRP